MKNNQSPGWLLAVFLGFTVFETWVVQNHAFFWDTVQLGSAHARFFFETMPTTGSWVFPTEIDSGHPPFFGMYLATCWAIFGKTLAVSHWAMWPFLAGIVNYGLRIADCGLAPSQSVTRNPQSAIFLLMLLADPVLAGQSLLVSPDLVLVFFFLMAVAAGFENRPRLMMLAVLGLAAISMRGMMTAAALAVWWIFLKINAHRSENDGRWRLPNFGKLAAWLWPFLPGGLLAAGFLFWHLKMAGWIGWHQNSPWAEGFQSVGPTGFLKNVAIFGWRWLDFGRVFLLAAGCFAGLHFLKRGRTAGGDSVLLKLVVLLAALVVFLSPSMLMHRVLSAHRYFLPMFLTATMMVFALVVQRTDWSAGFRQKLLVFAAVGLLTGNLWINPKGVSMDWDSTLAHLPYYGLRAEMLHYLNTQHIDLQEVGTAFPNIGPLEKMDLNGQQTGLAEKNLTTQRFIFWSNVFNDFTDKENVDLEKNWLERRRMERGGVQVVLYERR